MTYEPEEKMEYPTDIPLNKNEAALFGIGATQVLIVLAKRFQKAFGFGLVNYD